MRIKRNLIKTITILGIWMLLFTAISGCGQQKAGGNQEIRIFFSLNSMDTFRKTLVDAAKEKAAQEGVQIVVEDAQGSIETQVEQLKSAAEKKYDVIICSAVSRDTAVQLKMSAGDIPIIFVNSRPDEKHLEAGKYVYVGSDDQVAGEFQAEYVLEKLSNKQEINVVLLKGPKNHSATKGRTNGVKRALNTSTKQVHYVFEDYADWDTEMAQQLFELFLQTKRAVDCVICNNDSMALGVVAACKEMGIDCSTLPILGVDATVDGCAAIQNGEMAFTVYQSGIGQGQAAVEMAIRLAGGKSVKDVEGITEDGKYVWVDFECVDGKNVSRYQK